MYAQAVLLSVSGEAATARRRIYLCDTFEGIPMPNSKQFPADAAHASHIPVVDTSVRGGAYAVIGNFRKFGLMRLNIVPVVGRFNDTLPRVAIGSLALLRLDGDLFESTLDTLMHLYPTVADGGYVIVDDYPAWTSCKKAVDMFRRVVGITDFMWFTSPDHMYPRGESGIWWRKTAAGRGRRLTPELVDTMREEALAMK